MPNGYMTIQDHPFQVLGITARSTKRDVLERSDLAASADPDRITASRLQVTHPTRRIDAEVSWFPGLSPARIRQLLGDLQGGCNLSLAVEEKLGGLDPLAKINALAYWLVEHRATSGPTWVLCLHHLSTNAKILDAASELDVINADRTSAGFPAFNDHSAFQKAITAHFDFVARSLAERLVNDTEHHAKVLALIVERETQEGGDLAGEFVERFVDHYQVGVQPELQAQRRGIDQACEQLLSAASAPGQKEGCGRDSHCSVGEASIRLGRSFQTHPTDHEVSRPERQ